MTDNSQQNVEDRGWGTSEGSKKTQFKKGYDKRRWLNGRGKKSPEQREGDEILRAVIWEELSREFDARENMRPLETSETIDAFRLMVRGWIKKKPNEVAERIAGKVMQEVKQENSGRVEMVVIYDKPKTGNPPTDPTPKTD